MTHDEFAVRNALRPHTADLVLASRGGPWGRPWEWYVVAKELADKIASTNPWLIAWACRYAFGEVGERVYLTHQDTVKILKAAMPDYPQPMASERLCRFCTIDTAAIERLR